MKMHYQTVYSASRATAVAIAAGLLAACQTVGQPPAPSVENRLLAAGYVRDASYPRSLNPNASYDARYYCGPPACPVRGSVSYFTMQIVGPGDGRTAEERARTQTGAQLRSGLQLAADVRGSGRRYISARNISTGDRVGGESSSISGSAATGRPSYTRNRMFLRGNTMRVVVSNGETDVQARRGLALGSE
jgi:hypothetical protein